jgi:uncharacterized protein
VALAAMVAALLLGTLAPVGQAAPPDPTPYPGGTWAPASDAEAPYGVVAEKHQRVAMTDGVELTVDIYYPAVKGTSDRADGAFPVLLTQTPYTGSLEAAELASDTGPGEYFVTRGYIYISADVRGTGRSGGNGEFFGERDALDGADLVQWIVDKKFGPDTIVGLHGCSYLGHTQVYTAAALALPAYADVVDNVKAMIPMCVSSDPYRDTYMENGIPAPAWEGAGLAAGTLLGPTIEAYMVPKYLESQQGGDTAYDGKFWGDRDHLRDADAIVENGIAALLWNGWDDNGFGGLELYSALQNASEHRNWFDPLAAHDEVNGRYQLILGDWGHGKGLDEGIQLQWYDTWLKNADTGLDTETDTPVHVQDRVTDKWTNVSAYPFVSNATTYYLTPGGTLDRNAPDLPAVQTLAWGPAELAGTTLTYNTPALQKARVLAGPSAVHVEATTAADDVMLRAELFDVAPDGTATLVTWGSILGSLRRLDDQRSWYASNGRLLRPFLALTGEADPFVPANQRVGYDIPLDPTLWTVAKDHQLRLRLQSLPEQSLCEEKRVAITTSAVGCRPRAEVLTRLVGGQYLIGLGGATPTFVNLPLAAPGSFSFFEGTPASGRPEPLPTEW